MKRFNAKIIFYFMGLLLLCNGGFMMLSALFSWIYEDGVTKDLSFTGILVLLVGFLLMMITKAHQKEIKKRDGYLIVTLGWFVMVVSGMLPYLFTGAIPGITNAFFESMSGYTTTGATILTDIESLPEGVLFWRSITNWIGGMGFIVLAVAILPLLGIGGMQLFAAEAPGPNADKLHPRITDTAKRLWYIYFGYTVACTVFLNLAGMSFFDAVNHGLTSVSTGGFSTKNLSMAYWNNNPLIQYISMLFMFLGGTNFVLSYYAFKGKLLNVIRDHEFRFYFFLVCGVSLVAGLIILFRADVAMSAYHPMVFGETESAFRHALFQVISVITTTGYVSADFSNWTPFLTIVFFGLMFLGGSAGSTSGGVKVVRHLLMIKNGILEFKRALHPNAIIPVRYNGRTIQEPIIYNILGFFIIYMLMFIIGSLVLGLLGLDFESAVSGAASSLGNVGPGLGVLNPLATFDVLPALGKWWCAFLMLLGRLELFTVLILFTPYFWKRA
ncbi:TrkH family potassium uptake protein [Galbibacter sp.]|uniref:TrkH family potassium uptake protein n=1 Tax=Galbibacter sp. TaxID=2918471 RepID=UPI002C5F2CEB|nr:potassium transporter TrkG [Galbibacter sp.]HLV63916.1 potassium transporter TrkG [Galbibacter sp.]